MFGFFSKKRAGRSPRNSSGSRGGSGGADAAGRRGGPQEFRALGQDFLPEELNILAVTGASGFGGRRSQGRSCGPPPSA